MCPKCKINIWELYEGGHAGVKRLIPKDGRCTVPDPIDTDDWNVAMEWQRKYRPGYAIFRDIYMAMQKSAEPMHLYVIWKWIACMCEKEEAKIRIIAAILVAGVKDGNSK